jgi:hypothetical protein
VGACTSSHHIGTVGVTKAITAESGTQAGIAEAGETLTYDHHHQQPERCCRDRLRA